MKTAWELIKLLFDWMPDMQQGGYFAYDDPMREVGYFGTKEIVSGEFELGAKYLYFYDTNDMSLTDMRRACPQDITIRDNEGQSIYLWRVE